MRITFPMACAYLNGGNRVIAMFARELQRRGHEVLAVSLPPRRPSRRWAIKQVLRGRNPYPRWEPAFLDDAGVPNRVLRRNRPIVDSDLPEADVVVATWWETAEWVGRLHPSRGAKAYFIQQYEANFGQPADRVDATWRLPMQKIATSRWLDELARDRFGDPTAVVAPNGIDTDLFHAPPRGKQSTPTVGLMHSPVHAKGCDVALRALEIASRRVPGLRVESFGTDDPAPPLELPPGSRFVRQPPQDRLREIYARCDVWLCASRSEGYHLPPHEAMACRCPVVSTRVGGPMDQVRDGHNGFLVDVEDADALADRLVRVLTLPDDRWRGMSEAAFDTVKDGTWDKAVVRFEEGLLRAVARSKGGGNRPSTLPAGYQRA